MRLTTVIVLITLMMSAGNCTWKQSPPSTGTSQTTIDPCSLVTKDEVAAAAGEYVTEVKVVTFPRPHCNYSLGSAGGTVVVFVFNDSSARGGFEIGKTAQDSNSQPVTGIGDDAYWSPSIRTLNVIRGEVYLMVQLIGGKSEPLSTAKDLAMKAISRLP